MCHRKLKHVYAVTSGFGDGSYPILIRKDKGDIVKIKIDFIPG